MTRQAYAHELTTALTFPFGVGLVEAGVAGILVAGQPGLTRLVGVAPDADLLMLDRYENYTGDLAGLFTWAVSAGADVVLHGDA